MKTVKFISILALMLLTSVTANAQNSLVGDVNKDGSVNIADVTMVVDIILNGQKELSISSSEIFLRKDNSATIVITSGYGSYTASSADTNIADASLSGSTVIITGKKGGTTVVKVIDTISGNMEEISVTVMDALICPDENHPHLIDLGLPSGTKWACCNEGADKPETYGSYYAWGETEKKKVYDKSTYKFYQNGNYVNIGSDISGTEHDVAHVKWGGNWCMPTQDNINELVDNCTSEWTTLNGVKGRKFISKNNGNSIFLPAAGYRFDTGFYGVSYYGYYWSSTQDSSSEYYASNYLILGSGDTHWSDKRCCYHGRSVRPVVRK